MEKIETLYATAEFTAFKDLAHNLERRGYVNETITLTEGFERAGVPGLVHALHSLENPGVTNLVRQAFPSEFLELFRATARLQPIAA